MGVGAAGGCDPMVAPAEGPLDPDNCDSVHDVTTHRSETLGNNRDEHKVYSPICHIAAGHGVHRS
jgi:hypothetical protein